MFLLFESFSSVDSKVGDKDKNEKQFWSMFALLRETENQVARTES